MAIHCCGDNPDEACGWPPKTVRSSIAMTFTIGGMMTMSFCTVYFAVTNNDKSMAVLGLINGVLGTVIGYYFGSRNKQEIDQKVEEVARRLRTENRAEDQSHEHGHDFIPGLDSGPDNAV